MKSYWLLIETYVFIWKNESDVLIYNTLIGRGFLYKNNNEILCGIVDELNNINNLYCVMISEDLLRNKDVSKFIYSLEKNHCATLYDTSMFIQKPVVIFPQVNINEDIDRNDNKSAQIGENILHNLTDLYIELTGICEYDCKNCNSVYKQVEWCHKSTNMLAIDILEDVFTRIKHLNIYELHFFGGNVFSYPFIEDLLNLIENQKAKKTIYLNYLTFNENYYNTIVKFEKIGVNFILLVDFDNFIYRQFQYTVNICNNYIFIIESSAEYEKVLGLVKEFGINAKIYPFFNGRNYSFFKENVFLDERDILNERLSKSDIFANQNINTNSFGKLTLSSEGYLYANRNLPPIGLWNDDLCKIVHDELLFGRSWRNTRRNQKTCNLCIFKDLCPSPSNYEIAIGKPNLCHVHP